MSTAVNMGPRSANLFEEFTTGPGLGARPGARTSTGAREADLFLADLLGVPTPARRASSWPAAEDTSLAAEAAPGPIDAIVMWPNGKAYFFYGADYVRYDVKADKADAGYPKSISGNWPGLFDKDIDAAIDWGNGKVYFFKGNQYSRYDIAGNRVDAGYPKPIAANWPGLFAGGIDAAVNWGNGKAYFFKGSQYIRFDIASGKADAGYPKPIAGNWPGVFTSDIDDVINWGTGRVYFFKGDEYTRFDIAAGKADAGYPAGIAGKWPGLHPTSTCTCTHTSRNYASGIVPTANLIGTKATIKTRYGRVCCEGTTATSAAYKVAWTGVTKPSGTMVWAQTGWGKERNTGSATIKTYRYWEVNGASYNVFYDVAHPPAEGSTHTYQCEVDSSTGKWSFECDGTGWATHTDAGWRGITGTRADYTGEIFINTDDMPGTAADKCTYRDCKKKSTGGSYVDAGLTAANVSSTDATQWGAARINATGMDIWDKNPLP